MFDCDVDGGGDYAGVERVFVEGIEEAAEGVTAFVDYMAGFDVDCECKDDADPGVEKGWLV